MDRVHVLDCTLRDGGYCNGWEFGYGNVNYRWAFGSRD